MLSKHVWNITQLYSVPGGAPARQDGGVGEGHCEMSADELQGTTAQEQGQLRRSNKCNL